MRLVGKKKKKGFSGCTMNNSTPAPVKLLICNESKIVSGLIKSQSAVIKHTPKSSLFVVK